jgi:hypothetical protein
MGQLLLLLLLQQLLRIMAPLAALLLVQGLRLLLSCKPLLCMLLPLPSCWFVWNWCCWAKQQSLPTRWLRSLLWNHQMLLLLLLLPMA